MGSNYKPFGFAKRKKLYTFASNIISSFVKNEPKAIITTELSKF
jgi:hypothetical protein